jgi:hypothetical protein
MKKSFVIKVQSGITRKKVKTVAKTSGGKEIAVLPKTTGKVLKTVMNDSMMTLSIGKTASRIVSRKPLKQIAKRGGGNA